MRQRGGAARLPAGTMLLDGSRYGAESMRRSTDLSRRGAAVIRIQRHVDAMGPVLVRCSAGSKARS